MKIRRMNRPTTRGLSSTLAIAFFVLSVIVLLVTGVLQLITNFNTQREVITSEQQRIAQEAARTVSSFIQEKFGVLETSARLLNTTIDSDEEKTVVLESLLGLQQAFRQSVLLDANGQTVAQASRLSEAASGNIIQKVGSDGLAQIKTAGRFISPVYIDDLTGEPLVVMGVPVTDVFGDVQGTLLTEVNLKFMWDLVGSLSVGQSGYAYVVNEKGTLIAYSDTARVLRGESLLQITEVQAFTSNLQQSGLQPVNTFTGLNNTTVVGSHIPLETPPWAVVIELPWFEAYRPVITTGLWNLAIILGMALLAGLLGRFTARRLAVPIIELSKVADRITAGEMDLQAEPSGATEVAGLAKAFNSMTAQLRQTLAGLEQRVAERTAELSEASRNLTHHVGQLHLSSDVSRVATTITDPQQLIPRVVELIRERFDFYYVCMFLLDEQNKNAVLEYGTGEAGRILKQNQHKMEVGGESMVGWVAENKKARIALDIGEETVRFANPLLPDTHSEIALPLMVGDKVLGVLGVQSSEVNAFDETDVAVLQGMLDQVAIALTNAQLFEQTQQRAQELALAKEEADTARQASEQANRSLAQQMWQTTGQDRLYECMRGEQDISTLAGNVIQQLCEYLDAQVGTLYLLKDKTLTLAGSYAYAERKGGHDQFKLGEGLVGQVALQKVLMVISIPEDPLLVTSSLGELLPRSVLIAPFIYNNEVVGVIEMGTLHEFPQTHLDFLGKALESVAISFMTGLARASVNELLDRTQQQAEELQKQEAKLRLANQELESQTRNLKVSEGTLKTKQQELEKANTELEEKARALEESSLVLRDQQAILDRQNQELRLAQEELRQKADDLAMASKYKSEFLANMSHELRTPLNSLLILAGLLAKNEKGNLNEEQVESAQIIHNSGSDLLNLINEILDLSKVEAGKMEFHFNSVTLEQLATAMRSQFGHVAEMKGLEFTVTVAEDVPETVLIDQQRVEQIMKNLLSNAFKFTEKGSVALEFSRAAANADLSKSGLNPAEAFAIRVKDTGIGMTPEQRKIVFEAFQQADGSISRQYQGTGLGLTISRELAVRMGGQIDLESEPGAGSTFTVYLPADGPVPASASGAFPAITVQPVAGPWEGSGNGNGSSTGEPGSAALNNVLAPEQKGHRQNEARGTGELHSPKLAQAVRMDGTADVFAGKNVLIVDDDTPNAFALSKALSEAGIKMHIAANGVKALDILARQPIDLVLMDIMMPGMDGYEVMQRIRSERRFEKLPILALTAKAMVGDREKCLEAGASDYLSKPVNTEKLFTTLRFWLCQE